MTTTPESAPVTDADREAAQDLIGTPHPSFSSSEAIATRADDHSYVQAFARHRLAATAEQSRELVELKADMAGRFTWILEQAESAMYTSAGAATTHGDDSGALEMLNKIASDIGINSQMALEALTGGKTDDAALAKQGEGSC